MFQDENIDGFGFGLRLKLYEWLFAFVFSIKKSKLPHKDMQQNS